MEPAKPVIITKNGHINKHQETKRQRYNLKEVKKIFKENYGKIGMQ